VLLTYVEYQRLLRTPTDLADWLELDEEVEFEIGILRRLSRGLTVVTRNTRDVERAGIEYLNPWSDT
jgi:hypothetical protein